MFCKIFGEEYKLQNSKKFDFPHFVRYMQSFIFSGPSSTTPKSLKIRKLQGLQSKLSTFLLMNIIKPLECIFLLECIHHV